MPLNLSIIKSPIGVNLSGAEKSFGEQGGTLGRGDGNDWVLTDPDRFLSSRHCSIDFQRGLYYLTDTSTNGTFVNGSAEPLGKGAKTPLNNGDTIEIGDYQFRVEMAEDFAADNPFSSPASNADPFAADPFAAPQANRSAHSDDPFSFNDNAQDPFASSGDPFLDAVDLEPANPAVARDPFGFTHDEFDSDSFGLNPDPLNADPLAALDKAGGGGSGSPNNNNAADSFAPNPSYDSNLGGTYGDQADALNQSMSWPEAKSDSVIPEDWDDDLMGDFSPSLESAPPPPPPPQTPPVRPADKSLDLAQAHRSMPLTTPPQKSASSPPRPAVEEPLLSERRPEPVDAFAARSARQAASANTPPPTQRSAPAQTRPAASQNSIDALLNGLGLIDRDLSEAQVREIYAEIGELMPVIIAGMMQILRSRASIKNEFRMNVTTIQPIENNPLKFSADPSEAVENMFIRHSGAYLGAKDAFQEGFNGIGEHQVAIIAGIRAGFKSMMDRFNPEILERQFEKQNKGGLLPGMQKVKYWNSYVDYYQGFVDNMENTFQYLFGDEFVQAYEEQLRRLAVERKKRQHNDR